MYSVYVTRNPVSKQFPLLLLSLCILSMVFCLPAAAQADAYLDALQDEASGLSVDPETANKPSTTNATIEDKDLKQEAFENMMDEQYHGTYIFYSRLSDENRAAVYEAYVKSPDVKPLRQMIMDLLVN